MTFIMNTFIDSWLLFVCHTCMLDSLLVKCFIVRCLIKWDAIKYWTSSTIIFELLSIVFVQCPLLIILHLIQMYYGMDDVTNWNDYRMVGFVDLCDSNQFISRLEIFYTATELKIYEDGCSFCWNLSRSQVVSMTEIKSDLNVTTMASSVDRSRITSVYV